jgi:hypothetical protein
LVVFAYFVGSTEISPDWMLALKLLTVPDRALAALLFRARAVPPFFSVPL